MKRKFNLNHYAYVRITGIGFAHLKNTVGEGYIKNCILPKHEVIEGHEYYKLQMHEIISLFGGVIANGFKNPIWPEILIDESELK